jgi:hypothetical protein
MSDQSPADIIALPKGGGALAGLGEKFSLDLRTETGNFKVPINSPRGRSGFQPVINLVLDNYRVAYNPLDEKQFPR